MTSRRSLPGGELEQAVLNALWQMGSGTIRDLYIQVGQPDDLAYTTVAKVVDRLYAKGLVARQRAGISFLYRPRARRAAVERVQLVQSLDRIFGLDSQPAVARLVDAVEAIDPQLLNELAKEVQKRRKKRK